LPAFHIVGLADTEVRESRERVRAAIQCIGMSFPAGRIVVSLSPADLPKKSGRFDLPIALGVLLASGQIDTSHLGSMGLGNMVFAGELSLSGVLMDVAAPLMLALEVRRDQPDALLILPAGNATQAARVPGLHVLAASTLDAVVAHLGGQARLPVPGIASEPSTEDVPCLSAIRGQPQGRLALEVVASGGHSMLMRGWPGVGKSMLAQRLHGILPPMTPIAALEVAARFERYGLVHAGGRTPPYRAPHHHATVAALLGDARGSAGELALADGGVLFLDELPEFGRLALEALREPLESGWVSFSRASRKLRYRARCQLIAAMNPCPCGWDGHPRRKCVCGSGEVARYRARLSGPLLDRIDVHMALGGLEAEWMDGPPGEASGIVRERVVVAQARQIARQGCLNASLAGEALARHARPTDAAWRMLTQAATRQDWSARAMQRALRVARTLADVADSASISPSHVAQAIQFRALDRG